MNKYYIILYFLILFFNCNSETKKTNSNLDAEVKTISIIDTLSLKLNVNEKWIANLETHQGVSKMDAIISAFKTNSKTDYKILGEDLSKQTSFIIKHCSMKGESHDQLHVVLLPMLDEISILREDTNHEKKKLALHNLELLVSTYFKFFKV